MKLALAQTEMESGAVEANRRSAVDAVESAAARAADLALLPELFTVGYFAFDAYARRAESVDRETIDTLADVAAANDVAVLAGSIVEDLAASAASTTPRFSAGPPSTIRGERQSRPLGTTRAS